MTVLHTAALARQRALLVQAALEEDVGDGDWTTEWTVPVARRSRAVIVAKKPLVVAGSQCVLEVFETVDPGLSVEVLVHEGDAVRAEHPLMRMEGSTRSLLTGERAALNFLGHLSGIATLTRAFVEAVAGTGARIIDTRKTTPGWRLLEKGAVRAGGAHNHRVGLYDMVLVKDNHADSGGGVAEAAAEALANNDRDLEVEVEVRTLDELAAVLELGVDRVLLDNMTPGILRDAVALTRARPDGGPELEASGNVSLETVRAIAETGVDYISVGALTHSAPSADVSMRITD